jgi:hypothetical protein
LNEEDGIADIIRRVLGVEASLPDAGVEGLELLIVDDGSRDRTAEVVRTFPAVRLIRHPVNRGYGAAIKTGFKHARGELLAFLDADGTYPPEHLPDLCRVAIARNADVVVGSRRSGGASEMPLVRQVGNLMWSSLVSLIGNHRVADPASGMRLIRRAVLAQLYPLPDGLNFTPVMSTRSLYEELKVVEVPISYKERVGRSKLSVVRDGIRFLGTILGTALEYNPARVLGLAGLGTLSLAVAILLILAGFQVGGSGAAAVWRSWGLYVVLVLGAAEASLLSLGATFTYVIALFRRKRGHPDVFAGDRADPAIVRAFGWLGGVIVTIGVVVGLAAVVVSLPSGPVAPVWLWLVVAALLGLVGLLLVVCWLIARVFEGVAERDQRISHDLDQS